MIVASLEFKYSTSLDNAMTYLNLRFGNSAMVCARVGVCVFRECALARLVNRRKVVQ